MISCSYLELIDAGCKFGSRSQVLLTFVGCGCEVCALTEMTSCFQLELIEETLDDPERIELVNVVNEG